MKQEDVIQRIRFFRNEKNLSARELSLRLGKNENYINRLECTGFNLPVEVMCQIIELLEVSPKHFFADNYHNFEADNELYEVIKALPSDKKKTLLEFLKK